MQKWKAGDIVLYLIYVSIWPTMTFQPTLFLYDSHVSAYNA